MRKQSHSIIGSSHFHRKRGRQTMQAAMLARCRGIGDDLRQAIGALQ
jgi:hypothetical protein